MADKSLSGSINAISIIHDVSGYFTFPLTFPLKFKSKVSLLEALNGSIISKSGSTAQTSHFRPQQGSLNSSSTLSANIKGSFSISSSITASTSVSGKANAAIALSGNITSATSAAGRMTGAYQLKGSSITASSTNDVISAIMELIGIIYASTGVTGISAVAAAISGSIITNSTINGSAKESIALSGGINSNSSSSATLFNIMSVSSSISAETDVNADIENQIALISGVSATTSINGNVIASLVLTAEEGTTNLWSGDIKTYNWYGEDDIVTSRQVISDTYLGQQITRITYQPVTDIGVTAIQAELRFHGSCGCNMAYKSGNYYVATIYWRCLNSQTVSVGGTASNIPGWSDIKTIALGDGWYRSSCIWFYSADEIDSKYWSFKDPTCTLNEIYTIDWVCPQIEQKPYATSFVSGARNNGGIQSLSTPIGNITASMLLSGITDTVSSISADISALMSLHSSLNGISTINGRIEGDCEAEGTCADITNLSGDLHKLISGFLQANSNVGIPQETGFPLTFPLKFDYAFERQAMAARGATTTISNTLPVPVFKSIRGSVNSITSLSAMAVGAFRAKSNIEIDIDLTASIKNAMSVNSYISVISGLVAIISNQIAVSGNILGNSDLSAAIINKENLRGLVTSPSALNATIENKISLLSSITAESTLSIIIQNKEKLTGNIISNSIFTATVSNKGNAAGTLHTTSELHTTAVGYYHIKGNIHANTDLAVAATLSKIAASLSQSISEITGFISNYEELKGSSITDLLLNGNISRLYVALNAVETEQTNININDNAIFINSVNIETGPFDIEYKLQIVNDICVTTVAYSDKLSIVVDFAQKEKETIEDNSFTTDICEDIKISGQFNTEISTAVNMYPNTLTAILYDKISDTLKI